MTLRNTGRLYCNRTYPEEMSTREIQAPVRKKFAFCCKSVMGPEGLCVAVVDKCFKRTNAEVSPDPSF